MWSRATSTILVADADRRRKREEEEEEEEVGLSAPSALSFHTHLAHPTLLSPATTTPLLSLCLLLLVLLLQLTLCVQLSGGVEKQVAQSTWRRNTCRSCRTGCLSWAACADADHDDTVAARVRQHACR